MNTNLSCLGSSFIIINTSAVLILNEELLFAVVHHTDVLPFFFSFLFLFSIAGVNAEGKVDRSTWKTIQQVMNDSQKFVESLHHISWKEGLPDDILKGVQSFLAASSGGDVTDSDLRTAAPGASASTYQSSPGRTSVTSGNVC